MGETGRSCRVRVRHFSRFEKWHTTRLRLEFFREMASRTADIATVEIPLRETADSNVLLTLFHE